MRSLNMQNACTLWALLLGGRNEDWCLPGWSSTGTTGRPGFDVAKLEAHGPGPREIRAAELVRAELVPKTKGICIR